MCSSINEHTSFQGNINCKTPLYINGEFTGDIRSTERVSIGPKAFVLGNIYARSLIIEGVVRGCLYVKESLILRQSSQIGSGRIESTRLEVAAGAKLCVDQIKISSGESIARKA